MIWPFLARRLTLVAVAARAAHPTSLSVIARRTLFTTPQLNFPPAKSTEEKTAKKASAKGKSATPKRGRPPKNPGNSDEKKQQKLPIRIPQGLKPPKRAPGPYLLFYSSFLKGQPKVNSPDDVRQLSKRAAEIWRGYSMAEKQPFYDENVARVVKAKQVRDEFFGKMSQSDLKKLNKIRVARGKPKVHSTMKRPTAIAPFILFSNEFRNSLDGQAIINETAPEKTYIVRASLAAATRWNSMSEEDKAPYVEKFRKAKEELEAENAEHAQSS